MLIGLKQMRRVGLAVVAVGSIGFPARRSHRTRRPGTSITNTATVNYTRQFGVPDAGLCEHSFPVDTDRSTST